MKKSEFEAILTARVKRINEMLEQWLPAAGGPYGVVREAMRYSASAGGKRIRPVLVLEFARLAGRETELPEEAALPFACAVECVHTYSLIHDDLPCMDDDDLRRGRPSCHVAFGEANALLAGDGLLTFAFELIGRGGELSGLSPKACARACRILAKAAGEHGMIGGQVMDLVGEQTPLDPGDWREMVLGKTSALIAGACALGVAAAGGSTAMEDAALRYGETLGLAFQIQDDILDVTGDEQTLGKPVGSDQENGKMTAVTLYGLGGAEEYAARLTAEAETLLDSLPGIPVQETGFLRCLTHALLGRSH